MAVYGYTKNYKLVKPEYDSDTWHDYEYDNLDTIDAILSAIYQSGQFRGFWANNTSYKVKDVVIDRDTDTMYTVLSDHTTPSDVTFEAYRTAQPSYYRQWNANELAKDWAIKTDGKIIDFDTEDYSAKAYTIGGSDDYTPTHNAKYYSEHASASESVAIEKANAASVSASQALVSETNAKQSELNAKSSETNAKNSEVIAKAAQDDPNVVAIGTDLRATDSVIKNVNANKDDISSVAHISEQVVQVSDGMSDVVTVAGIESEVTTVAGVSKQVKDVGDNIQTVLQAPVNEANSKTWAEGSDTDVSAIGGTHSARGWAQLASEIVNLSDATETDRGIVRLATEQEAVAGTNDVAAVTPLKAKYIADKYTGKGLQLGFNGTLSGDTLTFTPDESAYELKQGYDYELDLLFPAVGALPDATKIVITNGSDTIQIVNVRHADASQSITYGDMKQICRYDTSIGWRWVFNARYAVTDTGVKVFVMPSYAFQDDRYVTVDTNQNINAGKNFINNTSSTNVDAHTNMSICLKNSQAELTANTMNADGTVNFKYQGIRTVDKNNEEISYLYSAPDGVGGSFTRLGASTKVGGQYADAFIDIEVDANGKGHLYIPNVDTASGVSGNQAATKEYVDARDIVSKNAAVPTGTIITWSTATAPAGYLICDGSAISRTTYANLFAVIGTTYGEGDGNTTFNLPYQIGGFPDYSKTTEMSNSGFTASRDGWCIAYANVNATDFNVLVNGTTAYSVVNNNYVVGSRVTFPVRRGDVITTSGRVYTEKQLKFAPCATNSCIKYT